MEVEGLAIAMARRATRARGAHGTGEEPTPAEGRPARPRPGGRRRGLVVRRAGGRARVTGRAARAGRRAGWGRQDGGGAAGRRGPCPGCAPRPIGPPASPGPPRPLRRTSSGSPTRSRRHTRGPPEGRPARCARRTGGGVASGPRSAGRGRALLGLLVEAPAAARPRRDGARRHRRAAQEQAASGPGPGASAATPCARRARPAPRRAGRGPDAPRGRRPPSRGPHPAGRADPGAAAPRRAGLLGAPRIRAGAAAQDAQWPRAAKRPPGGAPDAGFGVRGRRVRSRDPVRVAEGGRSAPPPLDASRHGGTAAGARPPPAAAPGEPALARPGPPARAGTIGRPREGAHRPAVRGALLAQGTPRHGVQAKGLGAAVERPRDRPRRPPGGSAPEIARAGRRQQRTLGPPHPRAEPPGGLPRSSRGPSRRRRVAVAFQGATRRGGVQPAHRAHHARPARPVPRRRPGGSASRPRAPAPRGRRVAPQSPAHRPRDAPAAPRSLASPRPGRRNAPSARQSRGFAPAPTPPERRRSGEGSNPLLDSVVRMRTDAKRHTSAFPSHPGEGPLNCSTLIRHLGVVGAATVF